MENIKYNDKVVIKKIGDIKPYEGSHNTDEAVDMITESIKRFGVQQPIMIDKDGVIAAGNAIYKAAIKAGLTELPCVVLKDLSDEEIKKYRIADNKTGEFALWNEQKLKKELSYLPNVNDLQFCFDENLVSMLGMASEMPQDIKKTSEFLNPKVEEEHQPTQKEIEKAQKAEAQFKQDLKGEAEAMQAKNRNYLEITCSKCGRKIIIKQ